MMNFLLFTLAFLVISLCQSTTISPLRYNTRYCISRPHYLSFMGPMHQKWPEPSSNKNNELFVSSQQDPTNIPYEIPKETFRKVFSHNLPSKKFR